MSKPDQTQLPAGYPSAKEIAEWKEKYRRVHVFKHRVDGAEDPTRVLIMRKPTVKDIERAQASDPSGKHPQNFNRSLLANCKLWGDEEALKDDSVQLGVFGQFDKIVNIAEVEVEEL